MRGILEKFTPDVDMAQRRGLNVQTPDWPVPKPDSRTGQDKWQDRRITVEREVRRHSRRDDGLVINGGFEEGVRFWSIEEEMLVAANGSLSFRGKNYLELVTTVPSRNYAARNTEYFDVDPGETFIAICAINCVSGTFTRGGARVAWFDFNGVFLSSSDIFTTSSAPGWQRLRTLITAPSNASLGQWEFYTTGCQGTVRWDAGRLKTDVRSDAGTGTIVFILFTGTLSLANGKIKVYIAATITPPTADVIAIGGRFRENVVGSRWRKFRIDDLTNLSGGNILWEERANIDPTTSYIVEMWPIYEGGGAGTVASQTITSASGEVIPGHVTNLDESVTIGTHSPELNVGHLEQLTETTDRSRLRGGLRIGVGVGAHTSQQTAERAADPVTEVINTPGYAKRINPTRVLMVSDDLGTQLSMAVDNDRKKFKADMVRLVSGFATGVDRLIAAGNKDRLADDLFFGSASRSVSDVSGWADDPGARVNTRSGATRLLALGLANKSVGDMDVDIEESSLNIEPSDNFLTLAEVTIECRKASKVLLVGFFLARSESATFAVDCNAQIVRVTGGIAVLAKLNSLGFVNQRVSPCIMAADKTLPNGIFGGGADDTANVTYRLRAEPGAANSFNVEVTDRGLFAMNMKQMT